MRDILRAAGLAAAILAATVVIWMVMAAPGLLSDLATTVPLTTDRQTRR